MKSIDALLFDLGGVIIDLDVNRIITTWAANAKCDEAELRARYTFVADPYYKRHEKGEISANDYFASLRNSLDIDISDEAFLEGWNAIFLDEVPGIAALLEGAAKTWPLYAFTNSNPAHEAYWSRRYAKTLGHFRHVFVSSTIGLRKPDAEAFAHITNETGIPATRMMFFDDSLENVEGARRCGLQAVHVTSQKSVPDAIATLIG
jgi:glucose-1-phosphatase